MRKVPVLIVALAFALAGNVWADDVIYKQITITKLTKQQFLDLHGQSMDIIEYKGDSLEIIATPENLEWLDGQGISYQVDITDLKAFYLSIYLVNQCMGWIMTFLDIEGLLEFLNVSYPSITSEKFTIGTSLEGNPIWAVKISDNPDVDEDEPELLYISLIHAREPAAAASLLHFMEYMLSSYGLDSEVTYLINNRELYFVPVQNPDGYLWNETTDPSGGGIWRKNRRLNPDFSRGVDLNRNYGYNWGYDNIGSSPSYGNETYRGPSAFSEPETQAYRDFVISRDFVIIHNFHTYSNLELWAPGYDREYDPLDDFFSNVGDSLTRDNGYVPQVGWRLYPTNGAADDWCWGDTISKPRIISFTCEIGQTGFWPNPAEIPGLVTENIWPNLFLARIAENPYVVGPPKAPIIYEPDTTLKANDYVVSWSSDDTLNPPVSYNLYELTGKSTVTDDVESNDGYWEIERFDRTTARSHSGGWSWKEFATNRGNHWLLSNTPYEVQENDSLKFWIWYAIEEDWDYFYAQVSTDGGFVFTNLANNLTTNFNPNNLNVGNGITGFSEDWVEAIFDLSANEGQQINIRLSYFTDNFSLEEGVYLDDIQNVDFFSSDSVIASDVADTFFTFTDQAPGDYWYRVEAIDAQDQVSRKSTLVKAHVPVTFIRGDVNFDTNVNVVDLNFMVNRIFRGGPAPNPILSGDASCDDIFNIVDLNFLVNYIFRAGSTPSCPL